MIARITYVDSEMGEVTATLAEDASWTGDDPAMVAVLNTLIGSTDRSPARGDWLTLHAELIAKMLIGTIEVESKTSAEGRGIRY